MASDEPVEDPYLTLGVAKDADISTIRSAHRKLVLKYHPDRLKGEAELARGKDVFRRVQQAYELLSDPASRSRYDDHVKLAQLKKEAMAREPSLRRASYPTRAPPSSTPYREYRGERIYEERAPSGSYFEEGYHYRAEEPRVTSRKYDGYERERRTEFGQTEKERKSSKWPIEAANDIPFNVALKFKAKAQKAREKIKERTRDKEAHASTAKSRYRDSKRERMDKLNSRRAYVEDDDDSSSDSDTATYISVNRPPPRTWKSAYDSVPRAKLKPEPPRRSTSRREDEEDEDEGKWRSIHEGAREYIERAPRPGLSGRTSSPRSYWETSDDRQTRRQSGSDTDTRPRSAEGRRPSIDVQKTHNSRYRRQTSDLSGTNPPRHGTTRYQIVKDENDVSTILIDDENRHRRTRSPSPPLRVRDHRDRPQRPTVFTDSRPRSSRGTSYQHLKRAGSYDYTGPDDSSGRSFWGSGPVSPHPIRQRTTAAPSPEAVLSEKPLPHNENTQQVECEVCGLDVKLGRKRDWQKHILEDLRPYQCLETGCPSASETYPTCMKLLAHIKKQHPKSELLTTKVLACPFCQEDLPQRKLQKLKHVGSHMEEIVLTVITRAYEDWTFYSDSEQYLSSASTQEQQQDNKAAETLNLPSAPPESPAAPEALNTVQKKVNTSPPIAKEASEMGEASDARQTNQEDEFGGPKSAKEMKELSPEARQVRTELKSTQPLAPTEER